MTSRDELIRTTNGSVGEIANHLIFLKNVWFIKKKPLCYICGIKQMMITFAKMIKSLITNVSAV